MSNVDCDRFPGSFVSPEAHIGRNVEIGIASRVYPWAEIGDDSVIGDYCIIGHPAGGAAASGRTVIGPESVVRSHAVIYQDVHLGPRFQTGHHTLLRDGVRAGINLRIGSFSDLEGECTIGDYCRFHGYVQVARGSKIGSFVWLFSLVTLTADPLPPSHFEKPSVVEDGVVVCVGCTVLPGTWLRKGAFVCAASCARGEVPPGGVVDGHRGEVVSHVTQLRSKKLGIAHPWMGHFADAYPMEAREQIEALHQEILVQTELYDEFRAKRNRRTPI